MPEMKFTQQQAKETIVTTLESIMQKYGLKLDKPVVDGIVAGALKAKPASEIAAAETTKGVLLTELRRLNPDLASRVEAGLKAATPAPSASVTLKPKVSPAPVVTKTFSPGTKSPASAGHQEAPSVTKVQQPQTEVSRTFGNATVLSDDPKKKKPPQS